MFKDSRVRILSWRALAFGVLGALGATLGLNAHAATIEILCTSTEGCGKFTGSTNDGTIFFADPDPTNPSTGTGVFAPFKRVQRSGSTGQQSGYNTDTSEPAINFDTKAGIWTRSVVMSEFDFFSVDGIDYVELQLDANEKGQAQSAANQVTISEMQIFIGGDPKLKTPEAFGGYAGTTFETAPVPIPSDNTLLGLAPVWNLDSTVNGDVNVVLQASICETNGQCGSGKGDLGVLIPLALLGEFDLTDYFVFYTEYSGADDGDGADAGFEEWRFRDAPAVVPVPAALPLFLTGLVGLGIMARRKRKLTAA